MIRDLPPPPQPPSLRCTTVTLPPYRYIPGIQPHPIKHHDGHSHTHPRPLSFDPSVAWIEQDIWNHGLDLFEHRFYWECHEVLEQMWHACTGHPPQRLLLQGLIQAAAFRLKWHQGQERPAKKLLEASLNKLQAAAQHIDSEAYGIDLAHLIRTLPLVITDAHWPTLQAPL